MAMEVWVSTRALVWAIALEATALDTITAMAGVTTVADATMVADATTVADATGKCRKMSLHKSPIIEIGNKRFVNPR